MLTPKAAPGARRRCGQDSTTIHLRNRGSGSADCDTSLEASPAHPRPIFTVPVVGYPLREEH
jgi:hypothetical protein